MSKYKYISKFDALNLRIAVSQEKDNILSLASIENIKQYLPNINTAENFDLLPISFDSCVVNKFNKNNDGIDSKTAVAAAKNFAYKPINIEHKRTNICGVILTASFTTLAHKPLSEEEALATEDPFYITLGGVVWRSIKPELADYIEDCADPASPNYEKVSASWELAFESCKIALREDNSRFVKGAEIIEDEAQVSEILNKLNSGATKYDGKYAYRLIDGGVVPVGIGLTENPAAEVKGVQCAPDSSKNNEESDAKINSPKEKSEKSEIKISTSEKIDVIKTEDTLIMSQKKLTNLDQLSDEELKAGSITASLIKDFFAQKIEEADSQYTKEKNSLQEEKNTLSASLEDIKTQYANLQKESEALKKSFETLKNEVEAQKTQQEFNVRMEYFDKTFELDENKKKIIAKELSSISSEKEFNEYVEKMKALLSVKQEKVISSASASDKPNDDKVIDSVISTSNQASPKIPNASDNSEKSYMEKYKDAFGPDQFEFQMGRNNRKNK